MQQNITECKCLIHGMLRNVEAETKSRCKMIYKLIARTRPFENRSIQEFPIELLQSKTNPGKTQS